MKTHRSFAVVGVLAVCAALVFTVTSGGRVEAQDDQILPGCNIPKSFGKLVTITNPPNSGLAGQAVFEDGDGTVRWVALMFSADLPQMPKPQRLPAAIFPQLPRYDCAVGHVWQRH